MQPNYKIIKVKALAKPGEVEAAISAFADYVIKDYNITAETDVICYKVKRPYISPSDDSYGMRWEIDSQELLALIIGYRAGTRSA